MKLILGTAQLCRSYGISARAGDPNSIEYAAELIQQAELAGFEAIDTASIYGAAEEAIGLSRTQLEIHTKLDPNLGVLESVEKSLQKLQRNKLDLVYIHNVETFMLPGDSTLSILDGFRDSLVEKIGVSVYSFPEYLKASKDPRIDVIQVPHNLFDRRFDGVGRENIKKGEPEIYARSIFLQGLLLSAPDEYPKNLHSLQPFGVSLELISLRYGISKIEVLVGFSKRFRQFGGMIIGVDSIPDLLQIGSLFNSTTLEEDLFMELVNFVLPDEDLVDPRKWR